MKYSETVLIYLRAVRDGVDMSKLPWDGNPNAGRSTAIIAGLATWDYRTGVDALTEKGRAALK